MKSILTKDNICAFSLGIALIACVLSGYNDNVACTIAGSLGGVITGKMLQGVTKTEQITLRALKSLDLKQQLLFVESYLPDAWEYLHDTAGVPLPKYDDNDDLVSWGATTQDSHHDVNKKEENQNESIS